MSLDLEIRYNISHGHGHDRSRSHDALLPMEAQLLERARQAHKHVEALLELSGGADSSAWKNSAQELVEALKNHFELGAKGKRSGKKRKSGKFERSSSFIRRCNTNGAK